MAIFDWNGTTNTKNEKAFDWNGTTSTKNKKAFDWDGTASHLIYSAEYDVLNETDFTIYTTRYANMLGTLVDYGSYLNLSAQCWNGAHDGVVNAISNNTFNLTGMSKLTFTISGVNTGWGELSIYVGVVANKPTSSDDGSSSGFTGCGGNVIRIINTKEYALKNTRENGTYTLDISSLSGNYYITLCAHNSMTQHNQTLGYNISNIVIS